MEREEPVDRENRPYWWDPCYDETIKYLWGFEPWADDLTEAFADLDGNDDLFLNIAQLWYEESRARIEWDQRTLSQVEYEKATSLLVFYSDYLGIYAPRIFELKALLTADHRDEDRELVKVPNLDFNEAECLRLLAYAEGEIQRLGAFAFGSAGRKPRGAPPRGEVAERRNNIERLYREGVTKPKVIAEQLGVAGKNPENTVSADLKYLRHQKRIV